MRATRRYGVGATYLDGDTVVDTSTAEMLGDAYGRSYADREEAEEAATSLQDEAAEYGIDPAVRYGVVEARS